MTKKNENEEIAALCGDFMMDTYAKTATVVRGKGCRVWDARNSVYLDFTAGISVHNVGHAHPKVVEAIRAQAETLVHCSNLYYTPQQGLLAQKLSSIGLGGKVFLCNSGAEANEAMIKLARLHGHEQGRYEIICMKNSFHGRTMATLSATGQSKVQKGFDPLLAGFEFADFNDLDSVKALVNERTVGILLECVQGEGGVIPATPEFLKGVRALCDEKDLLMMCDDIQCGMGRTGTWFAWEQYGVKPDVCTLAKALGGGLPIGALLASPKYSDVFVPGSHGSTFGGYPVACAVGRAVVELLQTGEFQERSEELGKHLHSRLEDLIGHGVSAVRGRGLWAGVDIDPAAKTGREVSVALRDRGVLCKETHERTLRMAPPLMITREELDQAIDALVDALEA